MEPAKGEAHWCMSHLEQPSLCRPKWTTEAFITVNDRNWYARWLSSIHSPFTAKGILMTLDVMVQFGNSSWLEKALIPIGTTFLGAGAGAFFAMLASIRLRKKDERNKNCEAAQWVMVCLFNQWHHLTRLQNFFKDAEQELSDVGKDDRYLFIKQAGLDHYKIMEMRLENLSHFALHGEPGLLIDMGTCQEMISDVMTHMKNRDRTKAIVDDVVSKSDMNHMVIDPEPDRAQWARMAINSEKLESELASYTARVYLVIQAGIDKHFIIISEFRKALKKLYPGTQFLGFGEPRKSKRLP